MRSLRPAVIKANNLGPEIVTSDLWISRQAATVLKRPDVRDLVLSEEPEQPDVSLFLARCCLGQVPGGAPFSQGSELATACTSRMQIKEPYKTN